MGQPVIQTSWNAGEWAPALNARVDLAKYHSGAALLRNFFVDYRGGATTRPGSKFVLPTLTTARTRLIPFQASFLVTYIIEFGNQYVRFYTNGGPVLEPATSITGVTQANPGVVTDPSHGYSNGNWIFISNVGGMTQLNGNYYIITSVTINTYTLLDLFGNPINTTSFNSYTSGGTAQRVYTINTPYLSSEVEGIKFVQDVNQIVLCHPNHAPSTLTLNVNNTQPSWTFAAISFGSNVSSPTFTVTTTLAAGTVFYAYGMTSVDANGQESAMTIVNSNGITDIRTTPGSIFASLSALITAAQSYNVYRTVPSYSNAPPAGAPFGFVGNIGNVTGSALIDSNITPDFSQGPPIPQNPFSGAGIQSLNLTNKGSGYTNVPTVQITGGSPTTNAQAICQLYSATVLTNSVGGGYAVGDILGTNGGEGLTITVTSVAVGSGQVTGFVVSQFGFVSSGGTPANPITTHELSGGLGTGFTVTVLWAVTDLQLTNPGAGYGSTPSVAFINGGAGSGATATATLGAPSSGNPSVPGFIQQRLVLAAPVLSPSQINFSQPGSPFNNDISFPIQPDDGIQVTLTNTTLNTIKSFTSVAAGLLVLTDKGAWVINGGSFGSAISATSIVANPQTYSGANDLPPIIAPNDILYMKSQGSVVIDLTYNFYLSNYTGTDISILSSHLFYGYNFPEWTWAEEPFKLAWAVRNDGQLLSLAFVKEQELVAWSHHDTQGSYQSIASVIEATAIGDVSAVYVIAQRTINGQTVQYIERFVELTYPNDYKSSWQVDAGIGYNGTPKTTFSGAQHLGGAVVTGVADGVVINFTMPTSGTFVFGNGGTPGLTGIPSASIVTVGLAFLPQIQTLRLDLGEPTVQGKRKKISAVTVRCNETLGLSIGSTFSTLTPMKDLIIGNVGTMSNALVTGLVTDDARTIVDTNWTVQGQFCIQQNNPYPASVLGIIPEIDIGDTPK